MPLARSIKFTLVAAIFAVAASVLSFGQNSPSGELTATRCWAYDTGEKVPLSVAADAGRVLIGSAGAVVESIGPDGQKLWSTELGGEISSNVLPADVAVFLVTSSSPSDASKAGPGTLRSLSVDTGVTAWTRGIGEAERHFLHRSEARILAVSTNGTIHSIDIATGEVNWKREIAAGFAGRPLFGNTSIIVASTGKQIFVLNKQSGEIESVRRLPHPVTALGISAAGEVIAGDERGNITSLFNGSDKVNWRFKSGGAISSIIETGQGLLAASHDNFVYNLVGRNGNVVWKRRLAGRAAHVIDIEDRYALISSTEDNGAAIVDLTSGKVMGQIAFSEGERLADKPVFSNSLIVAVTDRAAYAYSLSGCQPNKESGTAKLP